MVLGLGLVTRQGSDLSATDVYLYGGGRNSSGLEGAFVRFASGPIKCFRVSSAAAPRVFDLRELGRAGRGGGGAHATEQFCAHGTGAP